MATFKRLAARRRIALVLLALAGILGVVHGAGRDGAGFPVGLARSVLHQVRASAPSRSRPGAAPAFRPNGDILDDRSNLVYSTVGSSAFKYRAALENDWQHYIGRLHDTIPEPPSAQLEHFDGDSFLDGTVLVMYQARRQPTRPAQAVVLVHGASSMPDDFFGNAAVYLDDAGTHALGLGYDVYAPYVTHNSRFLNARRRLAGLVGESAAELDVGRVAALVARIAPDYRRIHLAGVSYGGTVAVLAYLRLVEESPAVAEKIGLVLSIEGFRPAVSSVDRDPGRALFAWNWEMVFPGVSTDEFAAAIADPRIYFAFGSWDRDHYESIYRQVRDPQVIRFAGGHEFSPEALDEALHRWRSTRLPSSDAS